MEKNKCIAFVLDDDPEFLDLAKTLFTQYLKNVEYHIFETYEEMKKHPDLAKAGLVILDMDLADDFNGIQAAKNIIKDFNYSKPFLFISGNTDYDFEYFSDSHYTYDFIRKPFTTQEFVNRVKVLFKVSNVYKRHEIMISNLEMGISDLFTKSEMFMLLLNTNKEIMLISKLLANYLGFSVNELIGKDWSKFIPKPIANVAECLMDDDCDGEHFKDMTSDIIDKDGKRTLVKWFNTKIKTNAVYILAMGIPVKFKEEEMDPDKIRDQFKTLIKRDKGIIRSISEDPTIRGVEC